MKKKYIYLISEIILLVVGIFLLMDVGQYIIYFIIFYWFLICYIINAIFLKNKNTFILKLAVFIISCIGLIFPIAYGCVFISNTKYHFQVLFGALIIIMTINYFIFWYLTNIKEKFKNNNIVFVSYYIIYLCILNILYYWSFILLSSPT